MTPPKTTTFSSFESLEEFTKMKYSDTFAKLSPGSKDVLLELSLFNPEEEMDNNSFYVLKAFYATLVSKNQMRTCVRAWTDPAKLSWGYGNRTISDIIKAPSSLAYIFLLSVQGPKNKYEDNDVSLYSMFLSKITDYVQKNGDKIFFCSSTWTAFTTPTMKKNNKLENIVKSCKKDPPRTSIDDDGE